MEGRWRYGRSWVVIRSTDSEWRRGGVDWVTGVLQACIRSHFRLFPLLQDPLPSPVEQHAPDEISKRRGLRESPSVDLPQGGWRKGRETAQRGSDDNGQQGGMMGIHM